MQRFFRGPCFNCFQTVSRLFWSLENLQWFPGARHLNSRPPFSPSALPPLRRLPLVRPFALLPARAPARLPAPRLPVLSRRVAVCVSWSCPVLASGWCCACPPPPLGASPCVPRLCCLSSFGSCSPRPRLPPPPVAVPLFSPQRLAVCFPAS